MISNHTACHSSSTRDQVRSTRPRMDARTEVVIRRLPGTVEHGSYSSHAPGPLLVFLLALVCLFLTLTTHDVRMSATPRPCTAVKRCPKSSYCRKYANGTCVRGGHGAFSIRGQNSICHPQAESQVVEHQGRCACWVRTPIQYLKKRHHRSARCFLSLVPKRLQPKSDVAQR